MYGTRPLPTATVKAAGHAAVGLLLGSCAWPHGRAARGGPWRGGLGDPVGRPGGPVQAPTVAFLLCGDLLCPQPATGSGPPMDARRAGTWLCSGGSAGAGGVSVLGRWLLWDGGSRGSPGGQDSALGTQAPAPRPDGSRPSLSPSPSPEPLCPSAAGACLCFPLR